MEWLNELIGFVILLLVFFIPLLRKLLVDKKKAEKREEPAVEEYVDEEPEYMPPPPPSSSPPPRTSGLVKKDFEFHTLMEERELDTQIEERELKTKVDPYFKERIVSETFIIETKKKGRKENLIHTIVANHSPEQAMILLSEILGKPKGLP